MARVMGCEGEFIVRGGGMRWARRGEWGVDDGEGGVGGLYDTNNLSWHNLSLS